MKQVSRILFIIFVFAACLACEEWTKTEHLHGFGGLNTVVGDYDVKPNACRLAHNIDWGVSVGALAGRDGYDSVSSVAGQDSVLGVFGAYYSDGQQQLIMTYDSTGVGYGGIYASPMGQAHFVGRNIYYMAFRAHTTYTYCDTIFLTTVGTDTLIVSYTTGGAATGPEIASAIDDSLRADSTINANFYFYANYTDSVVYLWSKKEFVNYTITADTGQTTALHGTSKSTNIWPYFSTQSRPHFAMFNDMVYITNGRQKGVVYDGTTAKAWPLAAPGEPYLMPIDDAGPLHGEYRYMLAYSRNETGGPDYKNLSYRSQPVIVDSGQVLIKDFAWVGGDSVTASPDSIFIWIYRTKANPGRITDNDYVFNTGLSLSGVSSADLVGDIVIDSVSDDALSTTDSICMVDYNFRGLDSSNVYTHRYGAPGYISATTATYSVGGDTTVSTGVYYGIPEQVDTLGVCYAVSFIDTVTGTQSDLGPPLAVWVDTDSTSGNKKPAKITLRIPGLPAGQNGIVRNLYRAHIVQVTHDTTFDTWSSLFDSEDRTNGKGVFKPRWVSGLAVDTIVRSVFRLVAQIGQDSTTYTDSTRYDSLQTKDMFTTSIPSSKMTNIFPYDGRMFGTSGSNLHFSRVDSAQAWGAFDFISLGKDDGDEITVAYPTASGVRVLKNRATYFVFQDANLNWNRREISNNYGCIAPKSYAPSPLGHYYLSDIGVVRENEGVYRSRHPQVELVSAPLDNFNKMSLDGKRNATAFYHKQKYMLNIGDTTYVYDELAQAWSTWSMTFSDATLYGVEDEAGFFPGDTMYFVQSGDCNLYRYGTSDYDNGSTFVWSWQSVPMFGKMGGYKSVKKVGIDYEADVDTGRVWVELYNEEDASVGQLTSDTIDGAGMTIRFVLFDEPDLRMQESYVRQNQALAYSIKVNSASSSMKVNRIWFDWVWLCSMAPK